ncbi:hypothetical protein HW932_14905 [Allochromatium humboldtianum]|uniref:Uncharacterized protein n=1 Tax=Allochromatium humboldtianum TaxID=504901 RepID=A0A850RHD7_9GAMM|nr:hypothetical protein [Allochromatium humboldtianum]NVZ10552.1 hypothetical protein [Allochromatium humboldtianum]
MNDLEFTTDRFLPFLPEDCQANPGVYGFELALWLSQALARAGLFTSYPVGEDWGWFIEYIEGEAEVMIGCSSQCEAGDGYGGQPVTWRVFIEPRRSFKQWLKRQPAESRIAAKLRTNIVAALRSEGIEVNAGGESG